MATNDDIKNQSHDDATYASRSTFEFEGDPLESFTTALDNPADALRRVIASLEKDHRVHHHTAVPPKQTPAMTETVEAVAVTAISDDAPWFLQQFFDDQIDLDAELSERFPTMPMMSSVKFRNMGSLKSRMVATLKSQDESAMVIIELDIPTRAMQWRFVWQSMLAQRYTLSDLSQMDRDRWLNLMQRVDGDLAFLWGEHRWRRDFLICVSRRYHTNIFACSPLGFESAVRLTPPVTTMLLEWLDEMWRIAVEDEPVSSDTDILTW